MGYTGGTKLNPSYYKLGDHAESVRVEFDASLVSYDALLGLFWENHDPFGRHSRQYMSAIFYHDEDQREAAEAAKDAFEKRRGRKVATEILPAESFYNAEGYHQKYLLQQHGTLLEALEITPDELNESHVCAKLNGWIGGYGKPAEFDAEWEKLGLNEKMAGYVRAAMTKRRFGRGCSN